MAKTRGLILGLALAAVASCAFLRGTVRLAEDAAPPGAGAVVGFFAFGGPVGAGIGAMLGVAVGQAIDGAEHREAQDKAVNELIRTGGGGAAELTLIGRIAAWVADFTELAVLILVGWTLIFWQLRKRPSDILAALFSLFRRAPAGGTKKPRAPRKR